MGSFKGIMNLFWNHTEKRLRAIWRLSLHTGVLFVLTIGFTVTLLFFSVILDTLAGTNIQGVIAGSEPMQIMENPWIGTVIIPGATFLAVILTTFVVGKWIDRRHFQDFGLVFSKSWWVDFTFGLALGAFLMALIFLFGRVTGGVNVVGFFEPLTQKVTFLAGFIQSVIFFVFVGIYEEVLSRGYHLINLAEGLNFKIIGKRSALVAAWLISSLVFGLLHMGNPNATWISTINITLAGIFLGLGMVLTGRLAIPIGLHITWNLFQGNVFGFPVSGTINGATIIATESIGPEWLTGGPFGPEAGVMGLAAMVIGSGLILLWVRRKTYLSLKTDLAEYEIVLDEQAE